MRAISLWQPWAWALFHGKPLENRNWRHSHRGPLLIHAAKTFDLEGYRWIKATFPEVFAKMPRIEDLPHMAFVGKVNMVDCVSWHPSPWFVGDWGHVYEDQEEFKKPIPWKGKQGIFFVPDEVIEKALTSQAQS